MNTDPTSLDRLHDLIQPPPVPWWPPAPAWWWVLGFGAVVGVLILVAAFLHWQRNRYRREALAELTQHEVGLEDPQSRAASLASMAELLKRAALSAWPRAQVASLTGVAWWEFLDKAGQDTDFAHGSGATLERLAYDPQAATALGLGEAQSLAGKVRHWLRHHRTEQR